MITITERAAREALRILADQGKPEAMVRIWIAGVGCAGYRYGLGIDEKEPEDGDQLFSEAGMRLVVDAESMKSLDGSRLQWVDDPENAGFSIENPNPAPSCDSGCCASAASGPGGEEQDAGCCGDG